MVIFILPCKVWRVVQPRCSSKSLKQFVQRPTYGWPAREFALRRQEDFFDLTDLRMNLMALFETSAARTMTLQVIKLTFLDNLADRSLLSRCVSSIFTAQIIVITVSFCKNASTDILHAMFSISIVHQFAAYPGPFCTNITRSAEASFTLPQWSVFLGHQSRPADAASKLLWSISPGLVQQAPPMWGM